MLGFGQVMRGAITNADWDCVQEEDSAALYACLRRIFERSSEFGGGLFALSASVMTDQMHHEPLTFTALEEAGLPEAFLNTIKVQASYCFSFMCNLAPCSTACTTSTKYMNSLITHMKSCCQCRRVSCHLEKLSVLCQAPWWHCVSTRRAWSE